MTKNKRGPVHNRLTISQIEKMRDERDENIRKLYDNGNGLSMNDIVTIMHYGKRTVWNAIHQVKRKGRKLKRKKK